jgi:hypothetical protein
MYKIFINDKPFIIADSVFIDNSFPTHSFEEDLFDTKISEALEKNFKGIVFNCNDDLLIYFIDKFIKNNSIHFSERINKCYANCHFNIHDEKYYTFNR